MHSIKLEHFLNCENRVHCKNCRDKINGLGFRKSISSFLKIEQDWICPFGIQWDEKNINKPLVQKKTDHKQIFNNFQICKYRSEKEQPKNDCKCKPKIIFCNHPEVNGVISDRYCKQDKCKFFSLKK